MNEPKSNVIEVSNRKSKKHRSNSAWMKRTPSKKEIHLQKLVIELQRED